MSTISFCIKVRREQGGSRGGGDEPVLGVRSGDQSEKEPMPPTCPPLLFSSFIMYAKYSFNSFNYF
jgi:hypothetical protein